MVSSPQRSSPKSLLCGIFSVSPVRFAVAAVIPLGKPVHQVKKPTRKPLQEIATRNRFDGPSF